MKQLWTIPVLGLTFMSFTLTSKPTIAATLFEAILNSEQEVFPGGQTNSTATGSASLKLNDAGTELAYTIDLFGVDLAPLAGGTENGIQDVATLLHSIMAIAASMALLFLIFSNRITISPLP